MNLNPVAVFSITTDQKLPGDSDPFSFNFVTEHSKQLLLVETGYGQINNIYEPDTTNIDDELSLAVKQASYNSSLEGLKILSFISPEGKYVEGSALKTLTLLHNITKEVEKSSKIMMPY